jgi:hypothetical protein
LFSYIFFPLNLFYRFQLAIKQADMAMDWVNPWVGLDQKFLDFGELGWLGLGWVTNPYWTLATRFIRNEQLIFHKVHSNSCALDPIYPGFYQ